LLLAATPAAAKTTVVADHLARPRGLVVAPDGTLYASLVGSGGRRCGFEGCFGKTGQIVKVGKRVTVVADGLLSMRGLPDGYFSLGADQLTIAPDGRLVTAISAEFDEGPNRPPNAVPKEVRGQAGRLVYVNRHGGEKEIGANIGKVEFRDDPDGEGKVSNPYGLASTGGTLYVSDSAANTLLAVAGPFAKTLAVFGHTDVDAQSVPAALTACPDGALYVGEYTGVPEKAHTARVWRVVPGQPPTLFATGFTSISALACDRAGTLYATELGPGKVVNVNTHATVASGLHYPGGIAVAPDGAIYVSDWSVAGATRQDAYKGHNGRIVRLSQ
jgi:sugar lactone lactonase YvrE